MTNEDLNTDIDKLLSNNRIPHDGHVLLWLDGEQLHLSAKLPWAVVMQQIVKHLPTEEMASKIFGLIATSWKSK